MRTRELGMGVGQSGRLGMVDKENTTTMTTERSRSLERLAKALRPPPVEELAAALQDCFNVAVREGAEKAAHEAAQAVKEELVPRLDKQDATLRLMWKQMKGNGKLPIDD